MVKMPDGTRWYPREYPNLVMRKKTLEEMEETRRTLEEIRKKTGIDLRKLSNKE